jgi:hypothetical protein
MSDGEDIGDTSLGSGDGGAVDGGVDGRYSSSSCFEKALSISFSRLSSLSSSLVR